MLGHLFDAISMDSMNRTFVIGFRLRVCVCVPVCVVYVSCPSAKAGIPQDLPRSTLLYSHEQQTIARKEREKKTVENQINLKIILNSNPKIGFTQES